jgi:hypothetical protein
VVLIMIMIIIIIIINLNILFTPTFDQLVFYNFVVMELDDKTFMLHKISMFTCYVVTLFSIRLTGMSQKICHIYHTLCYLLEVLL